MADAREQVPTGHAASDPGHEALGATHPGAGDVRSVKVDMGQGPPPPPAHRPAPHARTGAGASILTSAVLALLLGGAGAWGYERFLSPGPAKAQPAAAPEGQAEDTGVRKDLAGLDDRIKDLSDRCNHLADEYKQLQSRVEATAKATHAPDLAPIEEKVAQVDRLSQQVEALGKKVDPLSRKVEQYDRRIVELGERVDGLHGQDVGARGRAPDGRDRQFTLTRRESPSPSTDGDRPATNEAADRPAASEAADTPARAPEGGARPAEGPATADPALGPAESLFREGRYADAYASFRRLLQSRPDDARIWYFAALSYGLATGEWDRATRTMVEEGVAREKAGHPARPEIDSTFSGLKKETGKDWLDFYRRRAG